MKKLLCFIFALSIALNLFALRFGIDYTERYFEKEIIGKKNGSTIFLYEPDTDDFNSAWHVNIKENDSDFRSNRNEWRTCKRDKLQKYVNEESTKGNVVIHYKDELFYVGVNEERKATVAVEVFLKNFFDGKEYVQESHMIGNEKMEFAFLPNDKNTMTFKDAVLFQSVEGKIIPRLLVNSHTIYNRYPYNLLVSAYSKTQEFYGFKFEFTECKDSLMIDSYFNGGKSVADSIILEWKDNQFFQYKIDPSQL